MFIDALSLNEMVAVASVIFASLLVVAIASIVVRP
jgi:hypothetical protein